MVTRYNTGDAVLIPATIKSAEEINDQIVYRVEANIWDGIPENAIVVNPDADVQRAMERFNEALTQTFERR